ncbi:MAG: hypothetical protein MUF43_13110 [Flavobacterium sp.]|jgi:hypothetical protein|nr:hypothetical protein [Flavobacterium sp.]
MVTNNKYKTLYDFIFTEIDIGLEKTNFIKEYSKLPFNDGFLLKTVQANSIEKFKKILNTIAVPSEKLDFNIKFQRANQDVNNFIFHLINNENLKSKNWGIHEADTDFLQIIDDYNTEVKFQAIDVYELNKNKLQDRLYCAAREGSIYESWTVPDRQTEKMIYQFVETVFPDSDKYKAFEFTNWGDYIMGYFIGFILINIDKGHLTFFAKDDYD